LSILISVALRINKVNPLLLAVKVDNITPGKLAEVKYAHPSTVYAPAPTVTPGENDSQLLPLKLALTNCGGALKSKVGPDPPPLLWLMLCIIIPDILC